MPWRLRVQKVVYDMLAKEEMEDKMWLARLSERCAKMKEPDLQEPGQHTISLALILVQRKGQNRKSAAVGVRR